MKQALRQPTEEGNKRQSQRQMSCHHTRGQKLGHRQSTQSSLHGHQDHQACRQPGQPWRQLPPQERCRHSHHHKGDTDDESVKAVKPLQKHLNIHLATRQKRAEAQGPVGTGQAGLHHPGRPTDHHQSNNGNHKVSR